MKSIRRFSRIGITLLFTMAALGALGVIAARAARLYLPSLSATKTDTFIGGDGDGRADPGETIQYTVVIPNAGPDPATGVTYHDTIDSNTTLVGTASASPAAGNDTYPQTVIGNVSINSASIPYSVVTNDSLGQNPAATISQVQAVTTVLGSTIAANTAQGGVVVMTVSGADIGQFTYDPPAGYEGADTFTYVLADNPNAASAASNRTATVTLTVSGMVWFINNNAGACSSACDGRLSHPFTTLAAFNAVNDGAGNHPANNDNIFVYESAAAYTGGVTLRSGQRLIGQDATVTLAAITGLTPPSSSAPFPAMNTGAPSASIQNASGNGVSATDVIPAVVRGLTLSGSVNALDLTLTAAIAGTLEFKDNTIASSGAEGVDINKGGNAILTLDVQNNTWSGASTGNAFDARTTATAGTTLRLNFSNNTNINSAAEGVVINGSAGGTITITGFASNTVSGNTVGNGVNVNTVTFDSDVVTAGFQQVSGGAMAIGASGNPVGGEGLLLAGGSSLRGYLGFTDMDIFSTGAALDVTGAGDANTTTGVGFLLTMAPGVGTLNANGGSAATITNATIVLPLATITSANSSGVGVSLVGINDGTNNLGAVASTFSAGASSSIANATGTDFVINSNNADVTYDGTISDNNGGQLIAMSSNTGGVKSFTGSISYTGSSAGISLVTNTGATINFSGGLALSTGSADAFSATGGGTVNVTQNNTSIVNTLTTTTGTALRVTGTTIGASGLAFRSISSSGAPNGIYLYNTGAGGLTVVGTGAPGSGGTIQNSVGGDAADIVPAWNGNAGSGIFLYNAQNISFNWMQLNGHANFAIYGNTVINFTLANSVIDGANGTNGAVDEASVAFDGLTGSVSIANTSISGGVEDNFRVRNTSGSLNRITFNTVTIGANSATTGNAGILLDASGSATLNATIQGCTFTSAAGDLFHLNAVGNASSDLVFHNNTLSNNHPAIATGGGGVTIGAGDNTGTVNLTFNIDNNTFRDADGHAVLIFKSTASGTVQGTFNNNTIGVAGVVDSGSLNGDGIKIQNAGDGAVTVRVTNNHIYQYNIYGIELITGGGAAAMSGALNATITGNTITNSGAGAVNGVHLNGGTFPGDTFAICTDIGGAGGLANTMTGSAYASGIELRVRQRQSTTVRLPGYGGANNDNTAVQNYLIARNVGVLVASAVNSVPTGGGFVGGASCALPIVMAPDSSRIVAQSQPESSSSAVAQSTGSFWNAALAALKAPVNAAVEPAHWLAAASSALSSASLPTGRRGNARPVSPDLPSVVAPRPAAAGETFDVPVGNLPAGKSVTITFRVTVNNPVLPLGTLRITNQGTVQSIELPNVLTTNGGAVDCETGSETCTPVDRPDTDVDSISRHTPATTPTNAASVVWRVTFADSVAGLTASNFTLVNTGLTAPSITNVSAVTASPATQWDVTVNTGTGDGTLGLDMVNDNGLSHDVFTLPFTDETYTIDKTAPRVSSIVRQSPASNPTNADVLVFRVTFNESVTSVGASSFVVNGTTTTITNIAAVTPNLVFDFSLDGSVNGNLSSLNGTVGLNIAASPAVTDLAGNTLQVLEPTPAATNDQTYTVDNSAPTVANVTSATANGSYAAGVVIPVTVQFSEAVNVTGVPQLTLETGATDRTVNYISGSGTATLTFNYTVQAGDTSADLDYVAAASLALNGGTIQDAATNNASLTLATPGAAGSLGFNKALVIDTTASTVTNITSTAADGRYTTGAIIPVTVQFSEAVNVTGTPQLTLETGATDEVVDYTSGSGTNTLTFNYTVQAGDTSTDLEYVAITSLALNGGTIRDAATNNATLTLPALGAAGSLGFNKALVIDTTAPTVTNITSAVANTTYGLGAVIPITIQFSEVVNVTGTPQLTLETGATDEVVDYTSGSGTNTLTFTYTTQFGDVSPDLDTVGAASLTLNGGTIRDAATNNAALTLPTPGAAGSLSFNKDIVINATNPVVTDVRSTAINGWYNAGVVIPVAVTFSSAVNVTGTPQLTLETGATDRVVDYTSGSGTAILTFNYTVQAGDTSADLDYVGTTGLALNGGTIRDVASNDAVLTLPAPGTAGSLGANKALVIDTTAPTVTGVSSTSADGSYTTGAIIPVLVTFSEAVDVTGAPQLTLETGATDQVVDYTSGSGTATLTFNYIVQAGDTSADLDYVGATALALNGGTIQDTAANNAALTLAAPGAAGSLAANKALVIDTTVPTVTNVSSSAADGSYTIGAVIPVRVTFSEAVNVTGAPQLTLETGATDRIVNYTSGSGTATLTFNYTVQAGDTSADLDYVAAASLALNGGTIQDAATNNAVLTLAAPGAAGSLGFNKALVIDTTAPTVTNVSSSAADGSYTIGAVIPVQVTFSEAVNVTGLPQITLETGATDEVVDYTSGSGTATLMFNYTVQAGDTSNDLDYVAAASLALNSGTIRDVVTNNATLTLATPGAAGSLGANKALVIDTTAPTVTSVSSSAADGSYTTGAVIPVVVTFSEAVNVTGVPQLTLETGATDEVVDYTSGSGTATLTFNYTVQAGDTSADLDYVATASLSLNSGTIQDAATNNATLTLATPGAAGSLGANKAIVIDTIAPTVTSVSSSAADGSYTTGAVIPVVVTFSEAVDVTGAPQLTLETGATDEVVDYTSGSGTATLTFNYTVQAGDTSADLDYVAVASLALNGGTIQDAATNNADLTLPAPGAAGSLGANKALVIDTTAPTVTSVSSSAADGSYTTGAVIPVLVTFSEVVDVTGVPQLTLETGATDEVVDYTSGSGTATLTFNYTVQAGDTSADLDYVATASLALNGGTIQDAATNNATLTLATPGAAGSLGANKAIVIDTTAPTVTNVSSTAADGSYTTGAVIPVVVTFSEAVNVTGVPQLTLETGATDEVVDYTSGSGTAILTFNYTVQAGDTSSDLDYVAAASLALNGGTIQDVVTNNADLTLPAPGAAGSLGANQALVIDTTAPTVTDVTSTSPNGSYGIGAVIPVVVSFSEAVNVGGTPQITLETGATDEIVDYASGSGANTLTFNYTVQAGDTSADLDYVAAASLALNGGTIQDAATNNATLTLPAPGAAGSLGANKALVIDAIAPDTIISSHPGNPTNVTSADFQFGGTDNITQDDALIFECELDGGGFAACTSPLNFPGPLADGSHTFQVRSIDGIGNLDASPASYTWVVDTTAPTAVMTSTVTDPTNVSPIPVTIQFSENVAGFDAGDISPVVNGTINNFVQVDGDTYTFDLIPGGQGLVSASIAPGSYADVGGLNFNTTTTNFSRVYDTVVPTVSMSSAAADPTNGSPIPVTVTFSEAVIGFTAGDIVAGNGAVGNFAGSGASYSFDLTPAADGLVTADIAAGVAADAAGNGNTAAAQFSRGYDATLPTVSMSSAAADPTNGSPIPVTVTFSEAVSGFTASDIVAGNGAVSNFAGSGASYSFDLTPAADGLVTADIAAGVATDAAGNGNTAAAQFSRVYDATLPTVSMSSAAADPTNGSPIPVTVTFSEAVIGFTAGDIVAGNGAVSNFAGSGASYSFDLTPIADGLVTADIAAGVAADAAGNDNTAAAQFSRAYDATPPDTTITANPSDPAGSASASFSFTGSDTGGSGVVGFECDLDNGGFSACLSPENFTNLTDGSHTFQVRAIDAAGNADPTPASDTWTVDTVVPTVSMSSAAADPTNGSPIPVMVTFSEAVIGFTAGDIVAGNGAVGNFAGSGASYSFDLTPTTDGLVTADIAAGVATDAAGNDNTAAAQFSRVYDATLPTVSMSSAAVDPTNGSPIPVVVTFSEAVVGFTASDIVAVNGAVSNFAGSGASYSFDLTPTADGLVTADIAAGVATDAAGNGNTAAAQFSRGYEGTPPMVVSILRADPDPTSLASVRFVARFSEPVSGIRITAPFPDFSLTTNLTGAAVTGVSGSGQVYTVTVSTGSGNGALRLDLVDQDTILDAVGNPLGGVGIGNGDFTTGESYTVQRALVPGITASSNPVNEGAPVTFSGSFTYPTRVNTPLAGEIIAWDFGDGYSASGILTPTHTYGNSGLFTVMLTITDTYGVSGAYTLSLTVNNVAPSVDAGLGGVSLTDMPFAFQGSYTDPGWLETHTIQWDFGDNSQATGALTPVHTFTAAGLYTITLTVTDSAGGVGVDTVSVTVLDSLVIVDPGDDPGDEWSDPITTTTPCGSTFIGEFGNQDVTLTLDSLLDHTLVTVSFDLFIIRSWDGNRIDNLPLENNPYGPDTIVGPDIWQLQADSNMLLHTTFSNWTNVSMAPQAYPGTYPEAAYPAQTGASAVNSLCYTFGPYDMSAVYHMQYTFEHTDGALVLDFAALGLQDINDESWGLDNVMVSISGGNGLHKVYLPVVPR